MYRAWTRKAIEEIAREVYNEMNGGGNSTAPTVLTRAMLRSNEVNNGYNALQGLDSQRMDETEH